MGKFNVKTYDAISPAGLDRFGPDYTVGPELDRPDAIMLRSFNLHNESIDDSVLAIGRAGAGVNNIPVAQLAQRGVVVFNAPGANANSVKELVVAALLLSARNLPAALAYARDLPPGDIKNATERGKKQFAGLELAGSTLGVIGLGAIGHRVANVGIDLGMRVLGYDPALSAQHESQLSAQVHLVNSVDQLLAESDYVTLHVPLLDSTRELISAARLAQMPPGTVLLNFARDELVDERALIAALDAGELRGYVTDFPNEVTCRHDKIIVLPHLGASTSSAEDNCAMMIADELQDFLENGNITYSVNFPSVSLPRRGFARLTLAHLNEPGVIAQFAKVVSSAGINIVELINDCRGEYAYSIMELDTHDLPGAVVDELNHMPALLRLRILGEPAS
ncbi:MAG TPA: 3-phosphoglycerate dehydrogenase family protein [Streptosporangiaceae bacterium]|nr:3-phosphoglycerate dehydrogenase family protein [Streptosporangiaceae bacterium]